MTEASDIPANPDYRRIEDDYKEKRTGKGCIAGAACRWNLQYVDPDRSSRECKTGAVYFHVYQ